MFIPKYKDVDSSLDKSHLPAQTSKPAALALLFPFTQL